MNSQPTETMKHFLNVCLTASLAVCLGSSAMGQCTADYDFGDLTLGVSPNPELGETFDPGVLGLPYEDILHILLPQYVLDIDSTLPFSPPLRWTAPRCPTSCWWI